MSKESTYLDGQVGPSDPQEVPGGNPPMDEGVLLAEVNGGNPSMDEDVPPAEVNGGSPPMAEGVSPAEVTGGNPPMDEGVPPLEVAGGNPPMDEVVPPAGMPGGHNDCPVDTAGLVATLDLQSLPDFNVEEDFVILSKEIFTALESEEGDGFSVEDEFEVVMEEDSADNTAAVFVFSTDNNTLYYDANGADDGFGEDGGAIFEFAEIVGSADELTVNDFFLIA
jgi:hypothetical protein